MAHEKIEGVKPTRMELLQIRKRKVLATKGHELLSQKRDALISNFFEVIKNRKSKRAEMEERLGIAYRKLMEAEMLIGEKNVRSMAKQIYGERSISTTKTNIMGVPIVKLILEEEQVSYPYGIIDMPVSLHEAMRKGMEALKSVIEVAEIEGSIQRLGKEIEKTKRRVNALEHIFIPKLEGTIEYIERQLEEREREDFFRRKRMKALMEAYED